MDAMTRMNATIGVLIGQRNEAHNRVAELTVDLTSTHNSIDLLSATIRERDAKIAELERAVAVLAATNTGSQQSGAMEPPAGVTDLGILDGDE